MPVSSRARLIAAAVALTVGVAAGFACAAAATASATRSPRGRSASQRSGRGQQRLHVIVLLKAQFHAAIVDSHASARRTEEIRAAQAPLLAQLRASHATGVETYRLVDGFAATVSAAERARLAANRTVAAVIPDAQIEIGPQATEPAVRTRRAAAGLQDFEPVTPPLNALPNVCSSDESSPLLEPEGLALTGVDSTDATQATARSLGFTGAGVKVGFIADGLDPGNANFTRPDGSSVFDPAGGGDYQDFSGDGPGQPSAGTEGFIDANTIAGQGLVPYDVESFSAEPDPTACWIRIEGVAPGASLVGLDAVGANEDTTTSNFLEAIDYAVETEHVDVLNESFGSTYLPAVTALDAIKQFNDAAVAAGVLVTVQSGDGGPFDTIGTPASDPNVLSVGASTDMRFYAQTNDAGARDFASAGWYDDQISSLSSSGFDETGASVDLVAPGDLSFASCDPLPEFTGCMNFLGQTSDVVEAGGSGEAAAFAAGAAALVIEAYRDTHAGASPSPELVKQMLESTASDIGAPAQEQGFGLLDAYRAVELAASLPGAGVTPAPVGDSLLVTSDRLSAVARPHQLERFGVSVTNAGSSTQTLELSSRTFGEAQNVQSGSVDLTDEVSPVFESASGVLDNYETFNFTVPPGAGRLVGGLSWPVDPTYCETDQCATGESSRVRMILIDPAGKLAADSIPQGSGSSGTVEVDAPAPGQWEGVIFGAVAAAGGTNGTVDWQMGTEQARPFGWLWPSTLVLAPGQTESFTLLARAPRTPGDRAGAVVIDSNTGDTTTIPFDLRSLVDVVGGGGSFSGTLTGGNGRPPGAGQEQFYEFDVPDGVGNIAADLEHSDDPQDPVAEYLVSPDGDVAGYAQNSAVTGTGTQSQLALTAYAADPTPGQWTLIVDFAEPTAGNEVSEPYTGQITFDSASVQAPQLPDSLGMQLPAVQALSVPVQVVNTSPAIEDFFVDPRLSEEEQLALVPLDSASLTLPLTAALPRFVVPSETSSVSATSTAGVPAMFDMQPITGDPDVASAGPGASALCSLQATASFVAPAGFVTPGIWQMAPTECGPYPGPAPPASDSVGMSVETLAFDPSITSSTGDGWLGAIEPGTTFTPLVLAPGQSGTIDVTITPTGAPGTQVSGTLYLDTLENDVPPLAYGQSTGDEVSALPYAYTIAGASVTVQGNRPGGRRRHRRRSDH